jgi:hypothetical protein
MLRVGVEENRGYWGLLFELTERRRRCAPCRLVANRYLRHGHSLVGVIRVSGMNGCSRSIGTGKMVVLELGPAISSSVWR